MSDDILKQLEESKNWNLVQLGEFMKDNMDEIKNALGAQRDLQKAEAIRESEQRQNNVITLGNICYLDLPSDRVLENAKDYLEQVVILGWDANDRLYFVSSLADGGDVLWLMKKAEHALMGVPVGQYGDEELI